MFFICASGAEAASSETVRQVLAAKNLPVAEAKLENLDKNITSGAELDDANQFVIAYYLEDGTGLLRAPIFLDRYDRSPPSSSLHPRAPHWPTAYVATNEKEQALAFVISHEQIQLVQGDKQEPSGPKDVLYVYRRIAEEAKMEYREMLVEDAKARFEDLSLQNLVQREVLQKIFSEDPGKWP